MEDLFKNYFALQTFQNTKNKLIICIGAGGTGSAFIRDAARLTSVAKEEGQTVKTIICDADIVESNNLKRQCFSPRDIGKNKAAVMATRYGSAFELDMSYVDQYIEGEQGLNELIQANWMDNCAIYIFTFVDNVKTRLMVHNFFDNYVRSNQRYGQFMWIDCGNSEFAGQVVATSSYMYEIDGSTRQAKRTYNICPDLVEVKRDLLDPANWDKFASELSCEEAAVSAPQTMAANTTAANVCLNMLFAILFDEDSKLHYNMVTFAANKNVFRTTRIEQLAFERVRRINLDK